MILPAITGVEGCTQSSLKTSTWTRLGLRKFFFNRRGVKHWKRLLREVSQSVPSLSVSKRYLNSALNMLYLLVSPEVVM